MKIYRISKVYACWGCLHATVQAQLPHPFGPVIAYARPSSKFKSPKCMCKVPQSYEKFWKWSAPQEGSGTYHTYLSTSSKLESLVASCFNTSSVRSGIQIKYNEMLFYFSTSITDHLIHQIWTSSVAVFAGPPAVCSPLQASTELSLAVWVRFQPRYGGFHGDRFQLNGFFSWKRT